MTNTHHHVDADNDETGRRSPRRALRNSRRLRGDRGEGVISAAIAVLIMAFLGAAMWIGFQQMWKSTEATTNERISQIGSQ